MRVATSHPDFDDVKKKKNHTHLRCDECADCKDLIANSFRNGADLDKLKAIQVPQRCGFAVA